MAHISGYVTFNGNGEAAMKFYQACLGGDLKVMKVSDSPMAGTMSPEQQNMLFHGYLSNDQVRLMASDHFADTEYQAGSSVALCYVADSEAQVKRVFESLSAGGHITEVLQSTFFGVYGELIDSFGIKWLLQYTPPQTSAKLMGA